MVTACRSVIARASLGSWPAAWSPTTASGIEDLAAGGSPAYERLVREGVPTLVREDKAWVGRNAGRLDAALLESAPGG
jgi:hypothetical protein